MLLFYLCLGIFILLLTLIAKSHNKLNLFSIMHALGYFILTAYALIYSKLPEYFLENKYFFMDNFGLYEVLIASTIVFFASLYARGYIESLISAGELNRGNLKLFYVSINLLLMATTFSFFSNNLALFWIFTELTTIFSAILIVTLNAKKNITAALRYVFIVSATMLFSFMGLILLFAITQHSLGIGTLNLDELMAKASMLSPTVINAAFVFIFFGFAAKAGIAPFHTWSPHAYAKAPSVVSTIMSACIANIGIYGIIRAYAIVRNTPAINQISTLLILFGLGSIIFAALNMLQQTNLKKLLAFSSTENMGLMLIGIGINTKLALFWTLFHVLAHSLVKTLLFLSAGILHRQYSSNNLEKIKNAVSLQPLASIGLLMGSITIVGLPPFAIFLSKIFILMQAKTISIWLLLLVLLSLLAVASAFAIFLIKIFTQVDENFEIQKLEITWRKKVPIITLIFILLLLGILMPQQLIDLLTNITTDLGW